MSEDIKDVVDAPTGPSPWYVEPNLEVVYSEPSENVDAPEGVELNVPSKYGPPIDLFEPVEPIPASELEVIVKEADISEEQEAIKNQLALQFVINDRISAYPSVAEQLAALYEARQGNDKPIKEIDARIKEVKKKYPKPEEEKN